MIDLDALTHAATTLDPLPTSVVRLAGLVSAGAPELGDVVEIVRYDPALTATLLRAANSSWSASRAEITSVRDAVVRLGAGHVLSLALGVNLKDRLDVDEGDLWRHSVAASLAAETLLGLVDRRLPVETPTAALLHDIGKLVIARFVDPGDVDAVDHAELGGTIARSWELPEPLVLGIAHHHSPDDAVARGVAVADMAAKSLGFGTGDDPRDTEVARGAAAALGLGPDGFDQCCRLVAERFAEVEQRYS